jgi:nuclear pore complex protein Nup210
VSYREGDILLEDTAMVAAFRPLTVLHPASGETVLALGTSRQLVFVGGPRPWPGRGSEHGKAISQGDGASSKNELLEVLLVTFLLAFILCAVT